MWFRNGRNESFYSSKEGGDDKGRGLCYLMQLRACLGSDRVAAF